MTRAAESYDVSSGTGGIHTANLERGAAMASLHPIKGETDHPPPLRPVDLDSETAALREENRQLRDLVIQLSRIVLRNIAGQT
jgi:hypothetical protein